MLGSTRPVVHLHVPKTGGTSVREVLREKWPRLNFDGQCYSDHFDQRAGHTVEGVTGRAPSEVDLVLFLRDPFEQAWSFYRYWRDIAGAVLTIHGREHVRPPTFDDFLARDLIDWMSYLPGPADSYPDALDGYAFVGFVESFVDDVRELRRLLGLPSGAQVPHLLSTERSATDLSADQYMRLREYYCANHPQWVGVYDYARALRGT